MSDDSDGAGAHDISQVVESLDLGQAAKLPPVLVTREPMVPSLLDDLKDNTSGHQLDSFLLAFNSQESRIKKSVFDKHTIKVFISCF